MNWRVISHDKNKKYFEGVVKNGNLSHAYIFSGPPGIGKKEFAQNLFRLINNREPANDPDFKLISPRIEEDDLSAGRHGTKIYIENTRELKSFLSLKPYYGPYKFVVINDADRLTIEASNSILKSLEEPSPFSVIVLITSKPKLLLATVLSRCEPVQFLSSGRKKIDENTQRSIAEFMKISKRDFSERLQYAQRIYEKENYQELVVNLIHHLRSEKSQNFRTLRNLLELNYLVSQPQFNHRLAIENFLINL